MSSHRTMITRYTIPTEFERELSAYGPDPSMANWTSYPQYAYDQFYRGALQNPKPKKGKKSKKNPRTFERAEVASRMFQSTPVRSSFFDTESSGRHSTRLPSEIQLQRADWKPSSSSRTVTEAPVEMPTYTRSSSTAIEAVSTDAAAVAATTAAATTAAAMAAPKPYVPVQTGSWETKTEYQLVAPNAGPFLPEMFPYGMQGRPATYKNPRKGRAKKNPDLTAKKVLEKFDVELISDLPDTLIVSTIDLDTERSVLFWAKELGHKAGLVNRDQHICIEKQQTMEPKPWLEGQLYEKLNPRKTKKNPAGAFQAALGLAAPIAMGVSYSRNHSVLWAFLHGLIGLPYLVYVMATSLAGEKPQVKVNQAEARRVWNRLNPRQQKAIKAEVCQICEATGKAAPWISEAVSRANPKDADAYRARPRPKAQKLVTVPICRHYGAQISERLKKSRYPCPACGMEMPWAAKKNSAEDEVHKLLREATAADKSGQRSRARLLRTRAATAAHGTELAYHLRQFEASSAMAYANKGAPRKLEGRWGLFSMKAGGDTKLWAWDHWNRWHVFSPEKTLVYETEAVAQFHKFDAAGDQPGEFLPVVEQWPAVGNPGPRGGYSEAERESLEASDFAIPERRAWPLSDLIHGKIAIQYMKRGFGKRSDYARVAKAVGKKYPSLAVEAKKAASGPIKQARQNHNTFYPEGHSSVGDRPVFFQTYAGARRNGTKSGGYPFAEKKKQYAAYSDEQLAYARRDATEARDAMKGHDPEAEGWYSDDVSTIVAEVHRRAKQ